MDVRTLIHVSRVNIDLPCIGVSGEAGIGVISVMPLRNRLACCLAHIELSPCHAMQSLRGGVLNIVGMQQLTHHLYLDGEIYNHMNLVDSTAWLASIPVCVARQPRYNIYC